MTRQLRISVLLLALTISLITTVHAQRLVSATPLVTWTAQMINEQLEVESRGLAPATTGAILLAINYETVDTRGALDTASGLLAIPGTFMTTASPMLVYQHGTTDRTDVPSTLGGNGLPAIYFAGHGYYSLAPDFLGLGESRGFHPYIHADSEAWVAYHMMEACTEYAADQEISLTEQLFVTGYSQGGHAAMALHRYIQDESDGTYAVTASSPMSGPYDVSGTMVERVIDDEDYLPGIVFLPYTVVGLQEAYGNLYTSLDEVFKPTYTNAISLFADGQANLQDMGLSLGISLRLFTGTGNPREMLQDSIVDVLRTGMPVDHPMLVALRDNDLYNWVPDAPTRLFYCEADEQVPFMNSVITDSIMTGAGAPDVMSMSKGETLDHGGCFDPAGSATLDFFNSFRTVSTQEGAFAQMPISVAPNPVRDQLFLKASENHNMDLQITLTDLTGIPVYQSIMLADGLTTVIDVAEYTSGVYFLYAVADGKTAVQKIIIQ